MIDSQVEPASSRPDSDGDAPLEAQAYFAQDRFATQRCGAQIEQACPGRAVCSLEVTDEHRNAMGGVMGGAIFTLADFALAVASNFRQQPSVTATSTVEFLSGVKGTRLVATCTAEKDGRRLGFYTTRVEDDLGNLVALVHATCMRV